MNQSRAWATLFVLSVLLLSACSTPGSPSVALSTNLRVWLDQPPHGAALPLLPYTLKAHARGAPGSGVERITFLVNTITLGTINTDSSQALVSADLPWNPSAAGEYRIQAQAFSRTESALSEVAILCVGPECRAASPTATVPEIRATLPALPGLTPLPPGPQASPTLTRVPTRLAPTATRVVPSPTRVQPTVQTGCSGTPSVTSFGASPATIPVGASTLLSWGAVTNADSVSISPSIGGVATPGSVTVSPSGTTVYTLSARCGNNLATRQATVTVTAAPPAPPSLTPAPQDQTPPVISAVKPNSSNLTYPSPCSGYPSTLTVSANVADPSGVASVQLFYQYVPGKGTASSWYSVNMNPAAGNNYNATVNVGSQAYGPLGGGNGTLRFYVSARDNPGNPGNSSTLTVNVLYCPG